MNLTKIPHEMKALNQWVLVRLVEKSNGKFDKINHHR
jgi:primase-polymerase (primpol)-like protein